MLFYLIAKIFNISKKLNFGSTKNFFYKFFEYSIFPTKNKEYQIFYLLNHDICSAVSRNSPLLASRASPPWRAGITMVGKPSIIP